MVLLIYGLPEKYICLAIANSDTIDRYRITQERNQNHAVISDQRVSQSALARRWYLPGHDYISRRI